MNARNAAFLALQQDRIDTFLQKWALKEQPQNKDLRLAYEIALGTKKRELSLDFLIDKNQKTKLKKKEKILLRMAVYQFTFMERIPLYAIVNETIQLVKKYGRKEAVGFFNAILRKLRDWDLSLPEKNWSVFYSYPEYFVARVKKEYGDKAQAILEAMNKTPLLMARERKTGKMVSIKNLEKAKSKDYYIQNATPAYLLEKMARGAKPKRILDLCAAPGGKLLFCHDLFPNAELYANDSSKKRLQMLKENLEKYGVDATVSCQRAEEYQSTVRFDVVILDVPCSNTGVLHKRAEARWRLSRENIKKLQELQKKMVKHAMSLLENSGEIWYMTCSILEEENEQIAREGIKVLPHDGWDGGFSTKIFAKHTSG